MRSRTEQTPNTPHAANPEQLGVFQKSEIIKWALMVKDAGIQPE